MCIISASVLWINLSIGAENWLSLGRSYCCFHSLPSMRSQSIYSKSSSSWTKTTSFFCFCFWYCRLHAACFHPRLTLFIERRRFGLSFSPTYVRTDMKEAETCKTWINTFFSRHFFDPSYFSAVKMEQCFYYILPFPVKSVSELKTAQGMCSSPAYWSHFNWLPACLQTNAAEAIFTPKYVCCHFYSSFFRERQTNKLDIWFFFVVFLPNQVYGSTLC